MRALREQAAALNDMLALLRKRMRITEFYGQRGQTARKSGCHTIYRAELEHIAKELT
jgi:hypothetical protein